MVKLSQALSASGVITYRKTDYVDAKQQYYSEGERTVGEWFGKTAAALGLAGGVKEEHFAAMAFGQHPFTREQLVQHRSYKEESGKTTHRAAWDMNFAPPKSVTATALVAGDDRLIRAHDQAVRVTLTALEGYVQARLSKGRVLTTANFAVALFNHDTARPVGDDPPAPQLHTHAVLFNMTKDGDRFRSLDPRELYRVQSWATAIYRAELVGRLQSLGYQIERTAGAFEVAGYSSDYLKAISPRHGEIHEEMERRGLSGAAAANKIALSTRAPKQIWEKEALLAKHQSQAAEYGNQPMKVREAAAATGSYVPADALRKSSADEGVTYAKHRLAERNAVFDRYEVERDALRYGLGKLNYADVKSAVEPRRGADLLPVDHFRRYAPGERYTTPEAIAMEHRILQIEQAGRDAFPPITTTLTKDDVRQEHQARLNNAQMWLVWNISQSTNRIMGVQGAAGTGKTWGLEAIRKIIEHHGYETRGLAPTSSAAKELQRAGMGDTCTLQKFLTKHEPPQLRCVYFVDESSLASTAQMSALLDRLRAQDRLVIVGDIRQHQSVEAGRIFEEMQMGGMQTFHLEKIVRQQDPHLKAIVERFVKHDPEGAVTLMAEANVISSIENKRDRLAAVAQQFIQDWRHTLIVSPDNESRRELNAAVRGALLEAGIIESDRYTMTVMVPRQNVTKEDLRHAFNYRENDQIRFARRNDTLQVNARDRGHVLMVNTTSNLVTFRHDDGRILTFDPRHVAPGAIYEPQERSFAVGDRIQFTAPVSERHIANRDLATIEKLDRYGNARLRLEDGRGLSVNMKHMPHIDHGYALTTYSAQGKTADTLLMHAPVKDSRYRHMVDEAFGYVAVSRPRHSLKVYTDGDQSQLTDALLHRNLKPKALSREAIKEYQAEKGAAA